MSSEGRQRRAPRLIFEFGCSSPDEYAATVGGLPWEAPMTAIATSLTGPVAYAIELIGIAIAGGAMLWGGELTEFGRRACMIGLVVSVLVFAVPLLTSAFGVNAAVV